MLAEIQLDLIDGLCQQHSQKTGTEIDVLKSVSFILHDNRKLLESAVEILGEEPPATGVKQFVSSSCGRMCWKVRGSQDREYTCLANYCSCPSFFQQSKQADGKIYCKHLLAIKLATILHMIETETVSDERFVEVMCQETSTASVLSNKPYRHWKK